MHIPYCVRKCPYCDFYSSVDHAGIPVFLDCLEREMEMVGGMDLVFDTLYFGGGTPSVLEPDAIARVVDTANRNFSIQAEAEITLELNPGCYEYKYVAGCSWIDDVPGIERVQNSLGTHNLVASVQKDDGAK